MISNFMHNLTSKIQGKLLLPIQPAAAAAGPNKKGRNRIGDNKKE